MAQDRPNILLVVFDSLSAQHLNQHLDDLPTLGAFANQSLNFTKAYACSPESSPARASLFTGLDVVVHGLWTDGVRLPKREIPLSQVFAAQGYHSWLVGRRHLAGVSNWTTEHARAGEFHAFDWAHGPLHRSRQNAYLGWLQDVAPKTYADIFPRQADPDEAETTAEQRHMMAALPDELGFNTWVGQQVCRRLGDGPFFGIAGFVVGESMGGSSASVEMLDTRALRAADRALGEISNNVPKNTLVVVTAGRGCVADSSTPDLLQHSAINVPLLIRKPDAVARTVTDIVSAIDIARTLVEFAGIQSPQRLQGESLMTTKPRGWALSRLRHPDMPYQTALMSGHLKLIVTHDQPDATHLYDLHADPQQTDNLAALPNHQEHLETMFELMIDARVAQEDRTEPRIAKF